MIVATVTLKGRALSNESSSSISSPDVCSDEGAPPSPTTDPWYLAETASSHLGNYDDFWDELECSELFEQGQPRPIHSDATWQFLRGVYYGIVGPNQSSIDYTDHPMDGNGFLVAFQVEHLPEKGRAVIAAQDIPQGTMVWESHYTAHFPSPVYFRRFLATLPEDLACDVMIWAYAEEYDWEDGQGERSTISVDLDAGTFFNTIDRRKGETKTIGNDNYEAMRPIRKGEELLVDYGDFEKKNSWSAAGFGSVGEDKEEWSF